LEKWGDLLRGYDVIVQTDHKNSLWIWKSKDPKVEVSDGASICSNGTDKIVHIPGSGNLVPDALSRMHIDNLSSPAPSDSESRILRNDVAGNDEAGMETTDADIVSAMMNFVAAREEPEPHAVLDSAGGRAGS